VRSLVGLLALAALALSLPLRAQTFNERAAYAVMIQTPPGGLPPILSNAMFDLPMHAPDIALRLGRISMNGRGVNMYGATLGIPVGSQATIGVTAGYENCAEIDCGAHTVAGARIEGRLASTPIGTGTDARFTIGLNGEVGIAHPANAPIVSLTGGVPLAIVVVGPGLKIAPFLTPAIVWAHDYEGNNASSARFLLGGGFALMNPERAISANFGFQKVVIDGGELMFGVNLVFGFR